MSYSGNPEQELFKTITAKQRRMRLELIGDADTMSERIRIQHLIPDDIEREYNNHIFPTVTELPDRIDPETGEYIYD